MDGFGKFFHEFLQTVHFQRRPHDDEHIGFSGQICGLDSGDVVAEGMRFVVEHNSGA
jgi:hypothetical protein